MNNRFKFYSASLWIVSSSFAICKVYIIQIVQMKYYILYIRIIVWTSLNILLLVYCTVQFVRDWIGVAWRERECECTWMCDYILFHSNLSTLVAAATGIADGSGVRLVSFWCFTTWKLNIFHCEHCEMKSKVTSFQSAPHVYHTHTYNTIFQRLLALHVALLNVHARTRGNDKKKKKKKRPKKREERHCYIKRSNRQQPN